MNVRRVIAGAAAATGLVLGAGAAADAKITPEPVSCTNGGGRQAPGQQPECKGSGQTQITENQNPAGKAPPGQN